MTYNERVPYPVIVRAVSGDALAMEQVVERDQERSGRRGPRAPHAR